MTTYITDIKQASTILADNDIKLITFSHNISYDNDLSSIYYDDFISGDNGFEVQSFGSRQTDYLVIYGDNISKDDKYYSEYYLDSLNYDEMCELLDSLEIYNYEDNIESMRDELENIDNEYYYTKHFEAIRWYDLDSDFSINGYSQGDNIKVKLLGNSSDFYTEDNLTRLFYDTPVSGIIEIYCNGDLIDELCTYDYLEDSYEWDKVQFINNVSNATLDKEYHSLLISYLTKNLNDELNYNY